MNNNKSNPFTLAFGKHPSEFISRPMQLNQVLDIFTNEPPTHQVIMITGVRGSGKTVMLNDISKQLREEPEWITIELNPNTDMVHELAAKLYDIKSMHDIFLKAKFNFTLLGIGIEINNQPPTANSIDTALSQMLQKLKEHNKKLLITIDEVTNNEQMCILASSFQIFMREDYPIFLVMTGLYDNLYDLQNHDTLTFLYRAPKIVLEPLNYGAISDKYKNLFSITREQANQLTKLTMGYSFAFQVLGYLCWKYGIDQLEKKVMDEYDQYLADYVYSKIWNELSELDKNIVLIMAQDVTKVSDIRSELNMTSGTFSTYRDRLLKKGIAISKKYGTLSLSLPRFKEYALRYYDM